MKKFNLNRHGTCSVCLVVWEEGCCEAPSYPDLSISMNRSSKILVALFIPLIASLIYCQCCPTVKRKKAYTPVV